MGEQWHEARILSDADEQALEHLDSDLFLEIDHEHYEDALDCDLSLFLSSAPQEVWRLIFEQGIGHFRIRLEGGDLCMEPSERLVLDLPEAVN